MELIEQPLGVGVAVEVDELVRMAVPRQEFLHAQRAGAMRRAGHDDVAEAAGDERAAPEDEGPHEDLAQLGVGLHEREELLPIELDHLAGVADAQARQRAAPGEHVALAGELPRAMRHDARFRPAGGTQHVQLAVHEHEERNDLLADVDQHLAPLDGAPASACGNPGDLRLRQRRKQSIHLGRRGWEQRHLGRSSHGEPQRTRWRSLAALTTARPTCALYRLFVSTAVAVTGAMRPRANSPK